MADADDSQQSFTEAMHNESILRSCVEIAHQLRIERKPVENSTMFSVSVLHAELERIHVEKGEGAKEQRLRPAEGQQEMNSGRGRRPSR